MSLLYLLLIAAVQGVTEFLPISSSGHLALLSSVSGQADQGLAIDVAVHVGTLFAVVLYFWADVRRILVGAGQLIRGQFDTRAAHLALCLGIATLPVMGAGLALRVFELDHALRSVEVIGWATLIFGLVLYIADQRGPQVKAEANWGMRDALLFGLAQCLALIPGASRSGMCITAGRALGYDRETSVRLAMLMSIPTILASGALLGAEAVGQANWSLLRDASVAAVFAFLFALAALVGMMRLLRSVSFTPYVVYRLILGATLLIWAYMA